jgi:hypothetical protein
VVSAVLVTGGLTAGAATAPVEGPAATATSATRVDAPRPVLVIGDSAISAIRWVPGAATAVAGVDRTLDLESCRRLVRTSCRGREGRTPPTALQALRATGDVYTTVVVATGYNDGAGDFAYAFQSIVEQARSQGVERIVWLTLRTNVSYVSPGDLGYQAVFATNNATLRQLVATGAYPDVTIADWDAYTKQLGSWFASDGVHYRTIGAWGAADYLSRKLASMEGRPCPAPERPGEAPAAPCPDPDVTGPTADVDALYQVGAGGVLCYELGADRALSCRPVASVANG